MVMVVVDCGAGRMGVVVVTQIMGVASGPA